MPALVSVPPTRGVDIRQCDRAQFSGYQIDASRTEGRHRSTTIASSGASSPERTVRGVAASCLRQRRVDASRRSSVSGGPRSARTVASTVLRRARCSAARARHADKAGRTCSNRPTLGEPHSAEVVGEVKSVVWSELVTDTLILAFDAYRQISVDRALVYLGVACAGPLYGWLVRSCEPSCQPGGDSQIVPRAWSVPKPSCGSSPRGGLHAVSPIAAASRGLQDQLADLIGVRDQ